MQRWRDLLFHVQRKLGHRLRCRLIVGITIYGMTVALDQILIIITIMVFICARIVGEMVVIRIIGIVSARFDSTRFYGKMAAKLCGLPLLEFVIGRAKKICGLEKIVVATTERPVDDVLADIARKASVDVFRGPLNDVALRFLLCAEKYGCDYFIRMNGDSPFLDAGLVENGMSYCSNGYDLISNVVDRTFPYGISLEIVRRDAFAQIYPLLSDLEKEHITSYFYTNKERFKIQSVLNQESVIGDWHFTVDCPDDLERMDSYLGDNPAKGWREVIGHSEKKG